MNQIRTEQPSGIKPAALLPRVFTAVVYSIAVLGALWWGELPTAVLFGAMAGLAANEFYAMQRREQRQPNELFGVVAAAAMPIAAALAGASGLMAAVTVLLAGSLVWHTLFIRVRTADTAETVFGAVYTGFLLAFLVLIRGYEAGLVLSLAVVLSVWVNDVAAYFIGSMLGRHKLAPRISPKKSWEGFVAGTVACVAVWAVVPFVPASALFGASPDMGVSLALLTGLAVALSAVVGDLAESRMKREAGVKDSGTSLPGHGGFLDRLDSLILVCITAYWVMWLGGVR